MKRLIFILFIFLAIPLRPIPSLAQEEEGWLIAQSKYFSLYGQKELDKYSLLKKLGLNYLIHPETLLKKDNQDPRDTLAKALDALYLEVSDILDIHIYSFHGKISIQPDQNSLQALCKEHFGFSFKERSVYVHDNNTIYLSLPDLTVGMLGHEIAHAIISHYFVVPPPAKVQEVLCGYVEYTLRKKSGTLPK